VPKEQRETRVPKAIRVLVVRRDTKVRPASVVLKVIKVIKVPVVIRGIKALGAIKVTKAL
jgi:hypothetical protein